MDSKAVGLMLVMFCFFSCMPCAEKTLEELDSIVLLGENENNFNQLGLIKNKISRNGLIYIMDSDCSQCIATFLNLIGECQKHNIRESFTVIIAPGTSPIVNHYIKEYAANYDITIIENHNDIINTSLEEENGKIYKIGNNMIEKIYLYLSPN